MRGPYRDVKFTSEKGTYDPQEVLDADPPLVFGDDPLTEREREFWMSVYTAWIHKGGIGTEASGAGDKAVLRLRRRMNLSSKDRP